MTALEAFLVALYDDVSEAETAALRHGQERLAALLQAGAVPRDIALPVYHASEVEVTLDVRLEAEDGDDGPRLVVGEPAPDDGSTLRLTVDLFELVDAGDLRDLDLDDVLDGDGPDRGAVDPRNRPVAAVHGIGPTYAGRLHAAGIETLGELVQHTPAAVAEAVSGERIDVSAETVEDWQEAARGLEAVLPEGETDRPVELVDGIGPTYGRRLREQGVATVAELVQHDPEALADRVSTEELTVSAQQAAGWLEQAERVIAREDRAPPVGADRTEADADRPDDQPSEDDEDAAHGDEAAGADDATDPHDPDPNEPTDDGTNRQPDADTEPDANDAGDEA